MDTLCAWSKCLGGNGASTNSGEHYARQLCSPTETGAFFQSSPIRQPRNWLNRGRKSPTELHKCFLKKKSGMIGSTTRMSRKTCCHKTPIMRGSGVGGLRMLGEANCGAQHVSRLKKMNKLGHQPSQKWSVELTSSDMVICKQSRRARFMACWQEQCGGTRCKSSKEFRSYVAGPNLSQPSESSKVVNSSDSPSKSSDWSTDPQCHTRISALQTRPTHMC